MPCKADFGMFFIIWRILMAGDTDVRVLIESELEGKRLQMRVFPYLQNNTPIHGHTFAEIAVIIEGKGVHRTIRDSQPLVAGDVLLVPYGAIHAYEKVDDLRLINVLFKPDQIPLIPELRQLPYSSTFLSGGTAPAAEINIQKLHLDENTMEPVRETLEHMISEYKNEQAGANPCCMLGYFIVLLSQILRSVTANNTALRKMPEGIVRVEEYIRKHYAEQLRLDDLLKISHMSLSSFMRAFSDCIGTAPVNYLNEIRLYKACALLQDSDLSISEIALKAGFNDSNYFSRLFRKHLGTAPRDFRLTCGKLNKAGK